MKIKTLLLMAVAALLCQIPLQAADNDPLKYDIASAGSGVQGTYLVKVWVYSKNGKVTDEQLKYAAVHGCIFRGFAGGQGMPSQRPIAAGPTVEQDHADYFQAFFDGEGTYLQFASVVGASYERVKLQKKGYKVGAVVQVNKDQLRRELEKAGIVKGLSSGF
ncbi:MAG: hypothetical protein IKB97_07580 [Bacteroidaceae bacterium]|nr:hypothetical protein [Bacteroidaceae bacterium]